MYHYLLRSKVLNVNIYYITNVKRSHEKIMLIVWFYLFDRLENFVQT